MLSQKRSYLTIKELEAYASIQVTDPDEAKERIAKAEELIDMWVGVQEKYIQREHIGEVSSTSGKTIADITMRSPLGANDDYYKGLVIEILSGDSAGQMRLIDSSSRADKSVTYSGDELALSVGDVFKLYQVGKFPRRKDVIVRDQKTFKSIPEAVKRATAAQVAYMIEMGDEYFAGDASEMDGERIGKYSYARSQQGQSALVKMISPQARNLLRGITNRTGRLIAG